MPIYEQRQGYGALRLLHLTRWYNRHVETRKGKDQQNGLRKGDIIGSGRKGKRSRIYEEHTTNRKSANSQQFTNGKHGIDPRRVIDGPIAPTPCVSLNFYVRCDDCEDEATCILRPIMLRVRDANLAVYEKTTLLTMTESEALLTAQ